MTTSYDRTGHKHVLRSLTSKTSKTSKTDRVVTPDATRKDTR